ncbi:STE like transcription factor-domain-containing protein, partial [Mucidula mucida]
PLTAQETDRLAHLDRLKFFLATAPSGWEKNAALRNMKKFEEGVFSDLRNLKPGVDACLEEPKSPFLDLLFKYQCIRTQKKQKVFYWFSVPHDRLFLDALERDLKREKMGMEPTTVITGEPAMSFTYDKKRSLYEQFTGSKSSSGRHASSRSKSSSEGELEWNPDANHGPSSLGLEERGRTGYPNESSPDDPMTGVQQARGELGQPLAPSASSLPKVDMRDVGVGGAPNLAAAYPPSFDNYGQFEQTKVFRMEHLKRHLRTHTMERPFKFSRSDNLGQHMRGDQTFASGNGDDEEGDDRAPPTANIGVGLGITGDNVPSGADYGLNVEIEVPGDEEGLVTEVFASDYQYAAPQGGTSGYYALHPQHYGPRPMSSAGTSSSGSGSMYGDDDGAYLSMSAPSHKQVFDHASLYPSSSLDGGPVRRHRSMTPSVGGGGGNLPRGFHPYAHAGPSMYPVGLPRSSSRAGMMRSDSGGSVGGGSRPGSALSLYGGGPFGGAGAGEESPAVYASELPGSGGGAFHGHAHAHAATVPGGGGVYFGGGGGDAYNQYAPQHVSTM